jgi:hypothetical protein
MTQRKLGYARLRKQETRRRKWCYCKQKASSTVVPKGYYQDTKMQIAKDVLKRAERERRRVGLLV